ncbi:FAS1-like dehydratase domain-containing protein [Burkholderia sp. Ac-20379]|uniref:FAS1-like dehydratase domain-containing protein n=1 Tax=Burkholderia sp. Ac-20379 TaxID=2703900 RepID=UPI001982716D|nr:MaoC family dehydratase N-terminal domain-containing protein [Burkholderia sp. Ac-20379]MBN3723671.1 acyl-CoA dehydrogenase [Burkholderia sp. Ac-20379]
MTPQSIPVQPASQATTDFIAPAPAAALAATLDSASVPQSSQPLPPMWHWLYFWSAAPQAEIGQDGHPKTGGFLPDLGLPRRMAAGGRFTFHAPLVIGSTATRESSIVATEHKEGRSGRLAFVTVRHDITSAGERLIREEQDIVYREAATPGQKEPAPTAAPFGADWERIIDPTEVLLFRYSALTFNGHRIHYDRQYAQSTEGYPDLVVHGPLIATLLLDTVARFVPGAIVREYTYKAVRPTFLGESFSVSGRRLDDGKTIQLWAADHDGWLTMSANAVLA